MKLLCLLILIIAINSANCQAHRVNSQNLCNACESISKKVVIAVQQDEYLRYDVNQLRKNILSKVNRNQQMLVNAIFSGWSANLEEILQGEEPINLEELYQKLCIDNQICTPRQL